MIRCEEARWRMEIITQPVPNPPRGGLLILDITNVTGTNISGDVFASETATEPFTTFTGTCRRTKLPDCNIMTFEFVWGTANIVLAGVSFSAPRDINRLAGGFRATARTDRIAATDDAAQYAVAQDAAAFNTDPPPDPGDTGTGTGSQT
jgi:hypothetical protein